MYTSLKTETKLSGSVDEVNPNTGVTPVEYLLEIKWSWMKVMEKPQSRPAVLLHIKNVPPLCSPPYNFLLPRLGLRLVVPDLGDFRDQDLNFILLLKILFEKWIFIFYCTRHCLQCYLANKRASISLVNAGKDGSAIFNIHHYKNYFLLK